MDDAPSIEMMLQNAFARVEDSDAQVFYSYFDELKRHVRRYLHGKARTMPGETHIAQSALFSLFCDVAVQQIPLQDVDEHGYPMLWPMLLKYIERHCEKWKKYYRAKKRQGGEVPIASADTQKSDLDPADYRSAANDEVEVGNLLAALYERLTPRQRQVADLSAQGRTLEEIAAALNCSESLVSIEKKNIRKILEKE
jgi:RNA polymerase sigma factor (sigma-70 family)